MREFAAVIIAGIGILVAGTAAVALMTVQHQGWAFLCACLCIGFAIAFAIEYSDLRAVLSIQDKIDTTKPLSATDVPSQPNHPIR